MASKDMKYNLRVDSKDARKALQDTAGDVDDTRTKAQKLSDALGKLADDADAEFADMRSASGVMAEALGADFVEAAAKAGRSTDQIVQGLRDMGLSFDDIRGDADQLADAVKRLDGVRANVDGLGSSAKNASTDLDRVRDSGDQSRSVLANMVGNSTQDIAGLGGVAGTAGMALGQLGEYAAEGGISLSGLAKVAGPMAVLTLGTIALNHVMEANAKHAKDVARQTETLVTAQRALAEGNVQQAAETLNEEWKGTVEVLKQYGLGVQDLIGHMKGEKDITGELNAELDKHVKYKVEGNKYYDEEGEKIQGLIANLGEAKEAWVAHGVEIKTTDENLQAFTAALTPAGETAKTAAGSVRTLTTDLTGLKMEAAEARAEIRKGEEATRKLDEAYQTFIGSLDQADAFANFETAMYNYRSEINHSDQSTRDYKRDLAETIDALKNIPPETKAALLTELDTGSLKVVEDTLYRYQQGVTVPVRFTPTGDARGISGARAEGGSVEAGKAYVVGERGPEVAVFGQSGTVIPNHQLATAGSGVTINNTFVGYSGTVQERQRAELMARRQAMMLRAGGRPG